MEDARLPPDALDVVLAGAFLPWRPAAAAPRGATETAKALIADGMFMAGQLDPHIAKAPAAKFIYLCPAAGRGSRGTRIAECG